mmetsp:Transcript_4470/g.6341  ORF Transcript_4470/g.6341 Transcript_4470/m.6341 type:complete len:113 (-) Transcript_4470:180-518(-)|eukprot:CAMPEP_0184489932 /NCGR_PEP_ID=MMETSP0113_2-20130426/16676_1 /TAXON_ID=91329 /ORGANISM="Norrisiella sphaerica, Strain BC52" /LENGTH=112 /DNA_ID=CAMNT_0026873601 /DNA_START=209 /DNA_END=547 /DNA_ORIENTATION=-
MTTRPWKKDLTDRQKEKLMGVGPKATEKRGGRGPHNWGKVVEDSDVPADPTAGLGAITDLRDLKDNSNEPKEEIKTDDKSEKQAPTRTLSDYNRSMEPKLDLSTKNPRPPNA